MLLELLAAGAAFWLFNSSEKKPNRPNETATPIKLRNVLQKRQIEHIDLSVFDASKNELVDRARARGIEYLVHFTQVENLSSIKTYGLMSRRDLKKSSLPFKFNDNQRLDGYSNSVSLSVTSPNYRMFYRYRQLDSSISWAVILLDACKVLKNCDCAFQYTNAANHAIRSASIESRKTLAAFDGMFYNDDLRESRNLEDNEPTDPQAEILCFDTIPPKYFKEIVFGGEFFTPRHDWSYWKKPVNE